MDTKKFYGIEKSNIIAYLEFGEINIVEGKKKVWDFRLHQKAYDWLMLSRYANDLLAFNAMKKMIGAKPEQAIIDYFNKEVHHDDEMALHLAQDIAIAVTQDKPVLASPSFYELGQTIFGCIEGMELYYDLLNHLGIECPQINFKNIEWFGVDISEMFNELSVIFHKDYKVKTFLLQSELPKKMDVFFSKGITLLYAVRNLSDLFNIIRKGRIAVFDYSFSTDKIEDTTIGSGKTVRYLSLKDFINEMKKYKEVLYVKKSNSRFIPEANRVWLDCIYAEEKMCKEYIVLETRIRKEVSKKLSALNDSARFLNNDNSPEWISIEEFVKGIKI
jgi:hypothetical protein